MKKLLALVLTIMMSLSGLYAVAVAEAGEGPSGSITYMIWGSTVERDIVEKKFANPTWKRIPAQTLSFSMSPANTRPK